MQPITVFGRKGSDGDGEIVICTMELAEQTKDTMWKHNWYATLVWKY